MKRHKSIVRLIGVLAGIVSLPAQGVVVSFDQVDWGDGSGGYQVQDSAWGQATIQLQAADLGLLASDGLGGYYGYVNITTDTSAFGGSANNWAVENLALHFNDLAALGGGQMATTVEFDLGVSIGTDVTSLNYALDLTPAPLAVPTSPFVATDVGEAERLTGITSEMSLTGGGPGLRPAQNFRGANAGTAAIRGGSIAINETNVPAVNESLNGCAPGAAARSLAYLTQAGAIGMTQTAQQAYGALTNAMNSSTGPGSTGTGSLGTNSPFTNGKDAFVASNSLNVARTTFTNTPLYQGFFGTNAGSFAGAISALNRTSDVEVYLDWGRTFVQTNITGPVSGTNVLYGAHMAFVVSITPNTNAAGQIVSYTLRYMDDPRQQDGSASNQVHAMTILPDGRDVRYTNSNVQLAGVVGFFIEDVTTAAVPEPSLFGLFALGTGLAAWLRRRRNT